MDDVTPIRNPKVIGEAGGLTWLRSVEAKSPTGPEELVHLLLSRLPGPAAK